MNGLFRRLSVRQRIVAMVAVLGAMVLLAPPVQLFVQNSTVTRLQSESQALLDVDRLVLLASVRVAASQSSLLRYLQGDLATADEALRDVNGALLRLDEARDRAPAELGSQMEKLRLGLADYQVLIGQVQGAKLVGQADEASRLASDALLTGDGLSRQIETLATSNEERLAVADQQMRRSMLRGPLLLLSVDIAIVVVALALALGVVRSITRPIEVLRSGAEQLGQGHLDLVLPVEGRDELSFLARVFNEMAAKLAQSYANLEQRVADRTSDLVRRSRYMRAVIDVSQATTDISDAETLLQNSVDVIRDQFELYYVGLFLADAEREVVVLRAGTGEAGKKMLAHGYQLGYGEGMVGWSVEHGEARVSLVAEADHVRFANPDLPDTRSEAAIPLRVRDRVIGALTVQDDAPGAFDAEVVDLLQVMADLLAVTIENARLYSQTQAALESARRAYGQMTREGWMRLLHERPTGYELSAQGTAVSVSGPWKEDLQEAWQTGRMVRSGDALAVPIVARGEVLGAVQLRKAQSAQTAASGKAAVWSDREMSLVRTVVEQLGVALDSARLYEATQYRAARERVTREVADQMRATLDWEDLMQTAVAEIGRAVDASRVFVQWLPPQKAVEPPQKLDVPPQKPSELDSGS